jgi:hypothetical protein
MHVITQTQAAFNAVNDLDKSFIGTENYMGVAYFWHYDFRHFLRDATALQRKRVHDTFLKTGLSVDGYTAEHRTIVEKIVRK